MFKGICGAEAVTSQLKFEIVSKWMATRNLRYSWNKLNALSDNPSPFSTYEWFDCWYEAYCPAESMRVILVHDSEGLRAILPGMICLRRMGRFNYKAFCLAATPGTPLGGVIAANDDIEAANTALNAIFLIDKGSIHVGAISDVAEGSLTNHALGNYHSTMFYSYIENRNEACQYLIDNGWDEFLASKSKNFRKHLKRNYTLSNELGTVRLDIFEAGSNLLDGLERLKKLDKLTWQGQLGRGVMPREEDEDFFVKIAKNLSLQIRYIIFFLRIGDNDAAFLKVATYGQTAFLLTMGYDPRFKKCSPGRLVLAHSTQYLAEQNVKLFDRGQDVTEEKQLWETHRQNYLSYWLINTKTIMGKALREQLRVWHWIKTVREKISSPKNN